MTQPTIGRLDEQRVPYLLHECYLNRRSGVLVIHHGKHVRQISFLSGEVRHAKSNRMEQRLGQYLMRVNAIDRVQLLRALSNSAPQGPIGQRLVAMGFLGEDALSVHLEELLREIVFETCEWGRGEFRLYEGKPPLPENLVVPVPTVDLIFHGFKNFATEELAEQVIGDMNAPLLASPQMREMIGSLALSQADAAVLAAVNGTLSATQLLNSIPGDAAANLVILASLVACGLVTGSGQNNMAMVQDLLGQSGAGLGVPAAAPQPQPGAPPQMTGAPGFTAPQPPTPAEPAQQPTGAPSGVHGSLGGVPSAPQPAIPVTPTPKPEPPKPAQPSRPRLSDRDVELYRKIIDERFNLLDRNPTHYEILGIPIRATLKEVRTAYHHLEMVCDPELRKAGPLADLGKKMERLEEAADEAYRILGSQQLRDRYNRKMGYRKKW